MDKMPGNYAYLGLVRLLLLVIGQICAGAERLRCGEFRFGPLFFLALEIHEREEEKRACSYSPSSTWVLHVPHNPCPQARGGEIPTRRQASSIVCPSATSIVSPRGSRVS
ncbi:MAG: hypothetical protein P4L52_02570 [Acidocella sp.]|nr:hypothetical protein [Acidocella sp.]